MNQQPVVAAARPGYLPDVQFFRKMAAADIFMLADDVTFSRSLSRTRICGDAQRWLSIPVLHRGRGNQTVAAVKIDPSRHWQRKHWRNIVNAYQYAPYFDYVSEWLGDLYQQPRRYLLDVNLTGIMALRNLLGINTEIRRTSSIAAQSDENATGRIITLLRSLNAGEYLAGPADRHFLDEAAFQSAGIALRYLSAADDSPSEALSVLHRLFHDGPAVFQQSPHQANT